MSVELAWQTLAGDRWMTLNDELDRATNYEQGAHALLKTLLLTVELCVSEATTGPLSSAKALRALIQFGEGMDARGVLLHEPNQRPDGEALANLSTSGTTRALVQRAGLPVLVDVAAGHLELVGGPGERVNLRATGALPAMSRRLLQGREASHVLAFPLREAGRRVLGVITVELRCLQAIDTAAEPLGAWARRLQRLIDEAAPGLLRLRVLGDPSLSHSVELPVLGDTMRGVANRLLSFARYKEPLLLTGPSGVGKTTLARWAHERSPRSSQPFEALSLLAVPDELLDSTLLGHVRGAFTGADRDRDGAFARAQGGTLFIDDIDALSPRAQTVLLGVLERQSYRRLGDDGRSERALDVRFIFGSHVDLWALVEQGKLRGDLFQRLSGLTVAVPGLDQRGDELPRWAEYMARRFASQNGLPPITVHPDAVAALAGLDWPGNLRQLDQTVRRACIRAVARAPGGVADLVVEAEDLRLAIAEDSRRRLPTAPSPAAEDWWSLLQRAVVAFVDEAEGRWRRGEEPRLTLEHAKVFRELVVLEATARLGKAEGFRALKEDKAVLQGNHSKRLAAAATFVDELTKELKLVLTYGRRT
ncbi:sigma 54-interacting transcriptional regulator [Myxococcota bacterium]|nr:sigma 54-interacting transcriptional regulator [Myxococcota bacterium]